jgi:hypothetical protein
MHNLSILAMFKNESMIIKDWFDHYIREGVDHFYLIDNGSTDDYWNKIHIYEKYITLVKDSTRLPHSGTQTFLYNKIYLDKVKKETKWLIICDIDEYIYSRNGNIKIMDVLNKLPNNVENIWLPWKIFGSNGNINQPDNIIQSFTKRNIDYSDNDGYGKTICRTKNLNNIDCCGHTVQINNNNECYNANGINYNKFNFTNENCNNLDLHLNHYMVMSEEYYLKVKSIRGGGESGSTLKYTIDFFHENEKNYNKMIDTELSNKVYDMQPFFIENDKELFYKYLDKASHYLEYGSGGSTFQAYIRNNIKKIVSIESDLEWYNKINSIVNYNNNVDYRYCDMKTVPNNWGYPGSDSTLDDWIRYSNLITTLDSDLLSKLDLILIDGRFRIACCLKCHQYMNDNCLIVFDDFLNRHYYHIVLDYFEIIDKTNDGIMVILKKKNVVKPSIELIQQYEKISS